jgi:hypothetical protein
VRLQGDAEFSPLIGVREQSVLECLAHGLLPLLLGDVLLDHGRADLPERTGIVRPTPERGESRPQGGELGTQDTRGVALQSVDDLGNTEGRVGLQRPRPRFERNVGSYGRLYRWHTVNPVYSPFSRSEGRRFPGRLKATVPSPDFYGRGPWASYRSRASPEIHRSCRRHDGRGRGSCRGRGGNGPEVDRPPRRRDHSASR